METSGCSGAPVIARRSSSSRWWPSVIDARLDLGRYQMLKLVKKKNKTKIGGNKVKGWCGWPQFTGNKDFSGGWWRSSEDVSEQPCGSLVGLPWGKEKRGAGVQIGMNEGKNHGLNRPQSNELIRWSDAVASVIWGWRRTMLSVLTCGTQASARGEREEWAGPVLGSACAGGGDGAGPLGWLGLSWFGRPGFLPFFFSFSFSDFYYRF